MPGYETPPVAPASIAAIGGNFRGRTAVSNGLVRFMAESIQSATFTLASIPMPISGFLESLSVTSSFNVADGVTVVDIFINGVSWGAGTVTIPAGVNNLTLSVTGVTVAVVTGDEVAFRIDTTASTAGSCAVNCFTQYRN